ncbi:transcriptional regulator of arginine metabolism [Desulfohalotomaculum tongense]|uniref:arginine repressor n=1 Tax=Desulforadius tongensis TaxID=1216062 RepID=UPI00195BA942|nr:arginine repressor [Desulforadius tongensis]MBM7855504.1 transcriptional regulator of arginine metabolism [Desulforadius tongensis]
MTKARRQLKIQEIVRDQPIETQEELVNALRKAGFDVTQATVSRDIKELGLIKIPGENNVSRYAMPNQPIVRHNDERLKRLFKTSVLEMDYSENLIVIKTMPGEAMGVASAIDNSNWPEIIGTIGGDDNILVIVKPKKAAPTVINRFNNLFKE